MSADFEKIADITLGYEFGHWWPGIRAGFGRPIVPDVDWEIGSRDQRIALLRTTIWEAVDGPALPAPLALLVFDYAVMDGFISAREVLHDTLGIRDVDSPLTLLISQVAQGALPAICRRFQALALVRLVATELWKVAPVHCANRLCGTLSIASEWTLGETHVS